MSCWTSFNGTLLRRRTKAHYTARCHRGQEANTLISDRSPRAGTVADTRRRGLVPLWQVARAVRPCGDDDSSELHSPYVAMVGAGSRHCSGFQGIQATETRRSLAEQSCRPHWRAAGASIKTWQPPNPPALPLVAVSAAAKLPRHAVGLAHTGQAARTPPCATDHTHPAADRQWRGPRQAPCPGPPADGRKPGKTYRQPISRPASYIAMMFSAGLTA